MKTIRSREFVATRAWGSIDIANMNGITTRLHWTDQPYAWHVNDGEEVFAVLDGIVEMPYRESKQGQAGWVITNGPAEKIDPFASTKYFVTANSSLDLPDNLRAHFTLIASLQPICGEFLKAEYHWWK